MTTETVSPEDHTEDSSEELEAADPNDQLVPMWLAAVVLVLLLAVMGVGGFILRGALAGDQSPETPEERDIATWEQAVEATPNDPRAHLSLGFAYQQAELFAEAVTEYDLVLELSPGDPAASYNKGVVLIELGEYDSAEEVLWDVLEADPQHVLAAKALGEFYAERGEYRSLVAAVRPVVEVHESAADLQYLMGLGYENLGRLDWAEARYRLAVKYYPDMPEANEALERLGVDE